MLKQSKPSLMDFTIVLYASRMLELWQIRHRTRIVAGAFALAATVVCVALVFSLPVFFREWSSC